MTSRKKDFPEFYATDYIDPEQDDGNKEYKLKLCDPEDFRIEQFVSQMRFRMEEGKGEAIYTLGVRDDGGLVGLTEEEYTKTKAVLTTVAEKNNYVLTLISEQEVSPATKIYEFLIRENNPKKYLDIRVACTGAVDAGKSSLLGVLISGRHDNGRGLARLSVFNFQHEIKSGRTSSIAQHILGFDEKGTVVNYTSDFAGPNSGSSSSEEKNSDIYLKTWPEITRESKKIVTFFDLCGHDKYLKTTILGLTSQIPDLTFIIVGANMGISKMTKEHLFLCLSLHIPFVFVVTKIDICKDRKNVLDDTVKNIKTLLKLPGVRRIPYDVRNFDDVILSVKNIHSMSTVPIFYVSNVTGQGIDHLRNFLNLVGKRPNGQTSEQSDQVEFHVDQTFHVTGVGLVLGGQLVKGKIKTGDKLLLGPNNNSYTTIQVKSIHCKKVNVLEVDAGCYVCLAIKKSDGLVVKRGNVVISQGCIPTQVREFDAEVTVLKSHSTTIKPGYEPIVHTMAIRQSAEIKSITDKKCARAISDDASTDNNEILRTGDRAMVRFRFTHKAEYIKPGYRLLFCEGSLKVIGKVIQVTEENVRTV